MWGIGINIRIFAAYELSARASTDADLLMMGGARRRGERHAGTETAYRPTREAFAKYLS